MPRLRGAILERLQRFLQTRFDLQEASPGGGTLCPYSLHDARRLEDR